MDPGSRYEVLDVIAQGDFGRVCRARDRSLGREVAIKQIHPQFLHDQRQLARFWQEAQLLATLQHPNIINIYDVDRQRGWLIVELMRCNLEQYAHGQPIDLDFLRAAVGGCLNALQFLHANGVIHGDVKPSNILLDAQGRVKLGDFGLARRASSEGGSLLKGTTKYMAPELVANQFGPVGPASDLYSLGFAAYELMCGSQFEALFPGLAGFGRDRQIAWMMWHAAPDRVLPEIQRVLEGVPPDLARVVQRMAVKDQARRYQTAADALRDLRTDLMTAPPTMLPQEDAAAIEAEVRAQQKKRRTRMMAIGAMALSVLLCVVMLLPKKQPPVVKQADEDLPAGTVITVAPEDYKLFLRLDADEKVVKELSLKQYDRVFINDEARLLRDVKLEDHVTIRQIRDAQGRRVLEIFATRPVENAGIIKEIKPDEDEFTLLLTDAAEKGKEQVIAVPEDAVLAFNGQDKIGERPATLKDLQVDDRVIVTHKGDGDRRKAVSIKAERTVSEEGVITDVDPKKKTLALSVGSVGKQKTIVLPYADNCEVTVNKQLELNQRRLKPADLRPGDKAVVAHDVRITRVDAYRILGEAGVIQTVQAESRILDVLKEGDGRATSYQVDAACKITLGGEKVDLTQLRPGDTVDITHDSPDAKVPHATSVSAVRSADRNRWAIVIANQNFDDVLVSHLSHPLGDAKLLCDSLTSRYQVPVDQCLALTDESLVRLEQSIPDRLRRLNPDAKVLVYVAGHAYKSDEGAVYLAPKNFDQKRLASTGLALQWLVDQLEACPAREKLLLLDCSQAGGGPDVKGEPSTAEMLRTLKGPGGSPPLRTVTAIASCKAGQRGLVSANNGAAKGHGLFAWALSEGYRGAADKNRDNRIETTELFSYLSAAMPALAKGGEEQTPELFLPDVSQPRLSEEAKASIRKLAALLRQDKSDAGAVKEQYREAESLAGKEPEPKLLYGMLLLKEKQRDKEEALKVFEELKNEQPKAIVPLEGIAWARFTARKYKNGVDDLAELIQRLAKLKKSDQSYSEEAKEAFAWAGRLREFVGSAEDKNYQPTPQSLAVLDAAVGELGAQASKAYQEGRETVKSKLADFDQQISQSSSEADTAKLKLERRRLVHYAEFPYMKAAGRVLAGLKD